ncbi:MAG: hypothetical protein AB2777_17790 [Candidatus Thiodiazotropha endolucinida]
MNYRLLVFLVVFISGCAEIPRLTEADAETWGARFNDEYACKAAGGNRVRNEYLSEKDKEIVKHNQSLWFKEVNRRGLLSKHDQELIAEHKVAVGMSQCALYVSWGKPLKENKSVTGNMVHIQHVYRKNHYVYTVNGKVTSWQTIN